MKVHACHLSESLAWQVDKILQLISFLISKGKKILNTIEDFFKAPLNWTELQQVNSNISVSLFSRGQNRKAFLTLCPWQCLFPGGVALAKMSDFTPHPWLIQYVCMHASSSHASSSPAHSKRNQLELLDRTKSEHIWDVTYSRLYNPHDRRQTIFCCISW